MHSRTKKMLFPAASATLPRKVGKHFAASRIAVISHILVEKAGAGEANRTPDPNVRKVPMRLAVLTI
jgi:hypothetical protein